MSVEPEPAARQERDHRILVNLVAIVAILLLLIGAVWLMKALDQSRKIEACLEAKRPDCAKLLPTDDSGPPSY